MLTCDKKGATKKVFQVTEGEPDTEDETEDECPDCNGPHKLWDCFNFKRSDAKTKSALLRKLNLCFKCFLQHKTSTCKEENCKHCERSHHPSICYKMEAEGDPATDESKS